MKAIYRNLLDKSVAAALSSIEIYNKPDFKYREEVFVILLINAWELLLKAKIIKDERKISSVYVYEGRHIKKNRVGTPFTVDIVGALRKLELNKILEENLENLIDIRDTAIHFYNSESLSYLVYSLGAASLKNFNKLIKEWFFIDLGEKYNFNILPLGFAYNFKTFTTISLENEPSIIKNIIQDISNKQNTNKVTANGYYLICEIKAELISAKKISDSESLKVSIADKADGATLAITVPKNVTDLYPYTWTDIRDKLKKEIKKFNQNDLNEVIRTLNIKGNRKYSAFNFRSKKHELEYVKSKKVPADVTVLYNNDGYELIKSRIKV